MNVTPKHPEDITPKRAEDAASKRQKNWVASRLSLEARDPTPFEDAGNFWRAIAQAATIVMCVLMLGVLLYFARALLLPVMCAAAVGLTFGPLVGYAVNARHSCLADGARVVLLLIVAGQCRRCDAGRAGVANAQPRARTRRRLRR